MSETHKESLTTEILERIRMHATAITSTEETTQEYVTERDALIRYAFKLKIARQEIAQAAGIKRARLYQIRDNTR